MLNLRNVSPSDFYASLTGKKLYLFGAGIACSSYHEVFCRFYPVESVVDNNSKLWGKKYSLNGKDVNVIGMGDFVSEVKSVGVNEIVLLITSSHYGLEIANALNAIPELSGLECYQGLFLRFFPVKHGILSFSKGARKIPKKIHYCWFGGNKLPSHLQQYVDGWKRLCPDYDIIEWNESNYDVSKNKYMEEAYYAKKWGFVPDYARLDIIYQNGGIYLDTDVELVKRPDVFLNDAAFFGFYGNDVIALGLGFGAVKGHSLIKSLRDYYDDKSFVNNDGTYNMSPCNFYNHPVLKEYGFLLENKLQKVGDVVLYPSDVLLQDGLPLTENTIAHHHSEASWLSPDMKKRYFDFFNQVQSV